MQLTVTTWDDRIVSVEVRCSAITGRRAPQRGCSKQQPSPCSLLQLDAGDSVETLKASAMLR